MGICRFLHAFHNTIASLAPGHCGHIFGTILNWSGWFLMLIFILWAINREKQTIKRYLGEEISLGIISAAQYRTASSPLAQTKFNSYPK